MFAAGIVVGLILSAIALVMALLALGAARARRSADADERVVALEERVRGLVYRVWKLEGGPSAGAPRESPAPPDITPPAPPVEVAPLAEGSALAAPPLAAPSPAPPMPPPRALDLEQRIGARWATWVGIVAILVGVALFLKWAFDNAFLGPAARVSLGLIAGLVMLGGGLLLHRRRDLRYLSEGLAGGGLGALYLSLFAAHVLYGLVGPPAAFVAMFAVTFLGTAVAVASSRLITAVLAVLGGLLTPMLLQVERPDERNLLAYLLVLDVLVLLAARFRTWPALNRLAWLGSALLVLPTLLREPEAPRPLARLLLLSALFLIFLVVPLFRERVEGLRIARLDLVLVVANAAAYFWAVYVTLDAWHPWWEGPYALALAVLYRLVSADYASRVPDDRVTVDLHEGVSWTFLTLAVPLALDAQWVTVAWAVQGVMLLWLSSRSPAPVAAWAGLAVLLVAAFRAVGLDVYWSAEIRPVWNRAFLVHLLVVVALAVGGGLAGRAQGLARAGLTPTGLRAALWVAAVGTLAVQLWREPSGQWPAVLLIGELVVVGLLVRVSSSPAFVIATPLMAGVVLVRVLGVDDDVARRAAGTLVNLPLLVRVAACVAIGLAGGALARSTATPWAAAVGRVLSGLAGLALLFALSVNWTRYQEMRVAATRTAGRPAFVGELRWRTQVGLSLLWTLYAGATLAWGFLRSKPALRYAALALLGFTVFKVFAVDLGAVKTVYRILSFLVLGVVLLLVSLAYQKRRR
ncbi:MAG TPA: DUF2339 domain-containing protein [Methylomirabilota bacterium]|nr:DUF2339 domain-containing protein [Methylomirabilota bacterium]